ncbi:hypothetical protein [Streptomyces sp. NPDC093589]|uniref:hypothetical protein n=1 Tax=Streptomyces sp. NPDC093589 TaxID=3366043 RepID=UPI003803ABD3
MTRLPDRYPPGPAGRTPSGSVAAIIAATPAAVALYTPPPPPSSTENGPARELPEPEPQPGHRHAERRATAPARPLS